MPAIAFAPAAQNEASLETQRHSTLDQPLLPPLPYDSTVAGGSSLTANLNANMAQGVAALLPHRHTGNDAASNGENSADGYSKQNDAIHAFVVSESLLTFVALES